MPNGCCVSEFPVATPGLAARSGVESEKAPAKSKQ